MKFEGKWFYISIDRHGLTIALFNGKWDVEWHFHILKFDGENNYAKKNNL
jgi:hypothetical protein